MENRLMRITFQLFLAIAVGGLLMNSASAQLNQIGGGNTGGGTGGGGAAGPAAGGAGTTTQGPGGLTTQGPAGASANAGIGSGATQTFVGSSVDPDTFVGGGVQTQRNNARQFRGITTTDVPVGRPIETSGTPRQIPVSLKIGFALPQPQMISQLMGPVNVPIQRVAMARPEFKNVDVQFAKGGVAVIVGQVPTAASRRLAANLIRLQPGVRSIENRLLVAQPSTAPQPVLPNAAR